jgi:hypothetical protein
MPRFAVSCRNGGFSWEKRGKTMENHGKPWKQPPTNGGFGGKIVEKSYINLNGKNHPIIGDTYA